MYFRSTTYLLRATLTAAAANSVVAKAVAPWGIDDVLACIVATAAISLLLFVKGRTLLSAIFNGQLDARVAGGTSRNERRARRLKKAD